MTPLAETLANAHVVETENAHITHLLVGAEIGEEGALDELRVELNRLDSNTHIDEEEQIIYRLDHGPSRDGWGE